MQALYDCMGMPKYDAICMQVYYTISIPGILVLLDSVTDLTVSESTLCDSDLMLLNIVTSSTIVTITTSMTIRLVLLFSIFILLTSRWSDQS